MSRSISLAAVTCFAIVLLLLLSPSQALAASSQNVEAHLVHTNIPMNRKHWRIVASPNVGNVGSQLTSVAAVTASSIWSVGYYYTPVYATRTLVEYWNGSTWKLVASPDNGTDINQLNGVAAVSANDVWAVGYYRNGHFRTLIEHWDGTQWSIISSPNLGSGDNQLEAITAFSASDIWAVGTYFTTNPRANLTLIEHWNGTNWRVVASPNAPMPINNLTAVEPVTANNVWAVGYSEDGIYQTLVEHWNGTKWSVVASPNAMNGNSVLNGLSILAANDIWAAGNYYDLNLHRDFTLIEHWNGTQWSIIASPNVGTDFCLLYGIAAISANDVWAVGEDVHVPPHFTLTEHWNGTQWNIVSSPDPGTTFNSLDALIAVSGNLWAVGYYYDTQNKAYQTLVELYR
ncbi:MAG TPA: hypothetical protein VKU38_20580 [Ktedonobacteraceae bacterium]|nr:hypothetical protein [Ktedonobacteraceae bacterium]